MILQIYFSNNTVTRSTLFYNYRS